MESNRLILDNLNLIYFTIQKMGLYDRHEYYYDIGLMGLIKAARQFDESKGYTFSTYAGTIIHNEILADIKSNTYDKRKANLNAISLDSPAYPDNEDGEITLIETIPSNVDIEKGLIKKEQIQMLRKAIATLTDKEKLILKYYIYDDKTQKEIAEIMGHTQSYISRLFQIIIRKLRYRMRGARDLYDE